MIILIIFVVCRSGTRWLCVPKPSIEALYIGEYTLPVRLGVLDHVLHLQQGGDTSQLLSKRECQAEVVFSVLRDQRAPVKDVRVEDMDEGTECQTTTPAGGEVCHRNWIVLYSLLYPAKNDLLSTRSDSSRCSP